jgi:hypothetical protein
VHTVKKRTKKSEIEKKRSYPGDERLEIQKQFNHHRRQHPNYKTNPPKAMPPKRK